MRPTKIAYITLFALSLVAFVTWIIFQVTSVYDAARIMLRFVAPGLFVSAMIVVLVDIHLNPNMTDRDKSLARKGVLGTFGCGFLTIVVLAIIPIIMIFGFWIIVLIGYGQGL